MQNPDLNVHESTEEVSYSLTIDATATCIILQSYAKLVKCLLLSYTRLLLFLKVFQLGLTVHLPNNLKECTKDVYKVLSCT